MAEIKQIDIDATRELLAVYPDHIQTQMSEVEWVAMRLGDISRSRAERLIIAARQGKTTAEVRQSRRRP